MGITQLKHFVVAADMENFTKAAERLFMSRQALSKSIHNLEKELGCTLFAVENNGLVLMDEGRAFLDDARPVVRAYDALVDKYRAASARKSASVDLVTTHAYSAALPPAFFDRIQEENPQVSIAIDETFSDGVLDTVSAGEADIGILGSCPDYLAGFEYLKLDNIGIYLHVSKASPLALKDVLHIEDMAGVAMVTAGRRDHLHRFFVRQCAASGVEPHIVLTTSDVSLMTKMATERGATYFGFPEDVAPVPIEGFVVRRMRLPRDGDFGTYAVRRQGATLSGAAALLWESIEEYVGSRR